MARVFLQVEVARTGSVDSVQPSSNILKQEITVAHLVDKFPPVYSVHNSSPLSQLIAVHISACQFDDCLIAVATVL